MRAVPALFAMSRAAGCSEETMNRLRRLGQMAVAVALAALMQACGGSAATGEVASPKGGAAESVAVSDSGGGRAPSAAFEGGDAPSAPPPPAALESSKSGGAAPGVAQREAPVSEPVDRPGLGTQWGETRQSSIQTVPFVRAAATSPISMSSLFYNDAEGARAMASQAGFQRHSGGLFNSGLVSIGLRDEHGGLLSGFIAGGRNFVIGEAGRRYSIVIRNRTQNRLEIVVSVDGLDVIDGKPGAFSKRGYLVDPQGELEIDGFRQSMDTVAAFRFGSVRGSYVGQKTGDTRNVGVIGVAVFHERGTNPQVFDDLNQRQNANPFPGQFATPP